MSVADTKQDKKPIEPELLAEAITRISDAVQRLTTSGLNERAILVLLSHSSGLSQSICKTVLHSLRELRHQYCR